MKEEKAGLNLRSAYDFVMQTRRVVMNRLLHAQTTTGPLNGEGQKGNHKYALETKLAMSQLIDSVDSTTIASRITSIEPLREQRLDSKMERAIYTGPLDVPTLPMQQVKETSYLLDHALYTLLEKYTNQRSLETATEALKELGIDLEALDSKNALLACIPLFKRKGIGLVLEQKDLALSLKEMKELFLLNSMTHGFTISKKMSRADTYFVAIADIFQRVIKICPKEKYVANKNREIMQTNGQSRGEVNSVLSGMYQEFNSTLTGHQDEFKRVTGIEPNDFYKLVDLVNRYRSALPKRYLEAESNEAKTALNYYLLTRLKIQNAPRKERRETKKKVSRGFDKNTRLYNQLERDYGITDKQRLLFLAALVDPSKGIFTNEDKIDLKYRTTASLQREKEKLERKEHLVFYKRTEVVEILESLGIPGIIRAYNPRNFLELSAQPIPKPSFDRYDGPWQPKL